MKVINDYPMRRKVIILVQYPADDYPMRKKSIFKQKTYSI